MKLFKIWQDKNNDYDTYDSAVVCDKNEEEAKKIYPSGDGETQNKICGCWCKLDDVQIEYIGKAKEGMERGVIVASFNAG